MYSNLLTLALAANLTMLTRVNSLFPSTPGVKHDVHNCIHSHIPFSLGLLLSLDSFSFRLKHIDTCIDITRRRRFKGITFWSYIVKEEVIKYRFTISCMTCKLLARHVWYTVVCIEYDRKLCLESCNFVENAFESQVLECIATFKASVYVSCGREKLL